MGRCESTTASIGLKILLSDLILQINESNIGIIKHMLKYGFIEDINDYFNEAYFKILNKHNLPENVLEYKDYLIRVFKQNALFDRDFLFPIKEILSYDRWGSDRYGINSVSRPLDFDLSVDTEKYKEIEKTKIVFILDQDAS